MRDIDEAMSELARLAGLGNLSFENDRAELVFDGSVDVSFIRLDNRTLELAVYLDPPASLDSKTLKALLYAKDLGEATGAGRLALDTQTDRIVFCERLPVTEFSFADLETRLLEFVRHAQFWLSAEGAGVLLGDHGEDSDSTLSGLGVIWA
jgi:hypothetical protein